MIFISWSRWSMSEAFSRPKYKCNLHGNLTIVLGTMTIFLVGFLVTLALQAFSKKSKKAH